MVFTTGTGSARETYEGYVDPTQLKFRYGGPLMNGLIEKHGQEHVPTEIRPGRAYRAEAKPRYAA